MNLLLLFHLCLTWALFGLIWCVQITMYPLFNGMRPEDFPSYHARYMLRITAVVMPLMILEVLTAAALLWYGESNVWFLASLVPLALIWASTALLQVPIHTRLQLVFSPELHHKLLRTNWVRTLGWTLRAVMVAVVCSQKMGCYIIFG